MILATISGRDRLDIGPVRHLRIGHDRGRIRIDEDDAIAFLAQRLAGLRPRIIELAGLTDDDRARADDKDGRDIGALRHKSSGRDAPALGLPQTAFTRRKAPSRPIIDRKARVLGKILKRRRAGSADPGAALGRSLAENRSARKGLRGLHNRRTIAPRDSPSAGRGSCSRRWRKGEDQLVLHGVSRAARDVREPRRADRSGLHGRSLKLLRYCFVFTDSTTPLALAS